MTHYYGVSEPEKVLSTAERSALRSELGVEKDTCLIGLLGRVKHYKGQHLLVDTLIRALKDGQDVAALIIGQTMESDYLEDLKNRVEAQGLQERSLRPQRPHRPGGFRPNHKAPPLRASGRGRDHSRSSASQDGDQEGGQAVAVR